MSIQNLIKEKYETLSKGQKKVADLLLRDTVSFGMSTVSQIAKQVEVSETTVIRLSYALDFDSFSQMQKLIQKEYLLKKEEMQNQNGQGKEKNFIDTLVDQEIEILKSLKSNINMKHYWEAIDEIMSADMVRIVGYRASFSPAHWLYLKLNMFRKNVEIISSYTFRYPDDLLIEQDQKTVFIFISFPSYVAESLKIAQLAKKQGAILITFTDHLLSPISRISNISFTTKINTNSEVFISVSSVMSLLNIITSGIEQKYEKEVTDQAIKLQNLYKDTEYFLE